MKKIFLTFVAVIASGAVFTSCSDFLNEKMTTSFYAQDIETANSPEGLESITLGIYNQFAASGFKSGNFNEFLTPGSGLQTYGNTNCLENPLERWACALNFTRYSKHPEGYSSFSCLYTTIYRCNDFLDILENVSPVDSAYKAEIAGEVYFLRAASYFWLVRLYGDCSLMIEPLKGTEKIYKPRENFWTVYCQIIKDLDKAEALMRDFNKMVSMAGGNSSGRVCNYGATALRSSVYLTIGSLLANPNDNFWLPARRTPDFSAIFPGVDPKDMKAQSDSAYTHALLDAKKVIETGPFTLCPDYAQLFRWTKPEDWQLRERIFCLPRVSELSSGGSALTMWALPNYYNGTDNVPNYGRCRPDRWFFQKWCEANYDGTKAGSQKGAAGAKNQNIFISNPDPRMDVNIIHTNYLGKVASTGKLQVYNLYPEASRIQPSAGIKPYGIPYFKKYYDPTYNNSTGNSDFYVMRLAEVYLIAAEACAALDEFNAAVDYVNIIRRRARGEMSASATKSDYPKDIAASDFATAQDLINCIFWERAFEMPFEQHEWFDTHRFGAKWIADNIAKPKNEFLKLPEQQDWTENGVQYSGYTSIYYGKNFQYNTETALIRKGIISAYPNDELVYNSELDVNLRDPNYGQNPEEVFWR